MFWYRHSSNGCGAKDAFFFPLALIENHATDDGQVPGGRKQPCMPGDTIEQVRSRIVDLSDDPLPISHLGCRRVFLQVCSRLKAGRFKFQHVVEMTLGIVIESEAADLLDHLAQDKESNVGVFELSPRGCRKWKLVDALPCLFNAVFVIG